MVRDILVNALYLLALVNPVSKVSLLSVFSTQEDRGQIVPVSAKASLVGAGILILVMTGGELVLRDIFHVELYSLKIAGGVVLFWVGFAALRKGVFFEQGTQARFADISIVPLACPLIAGPATIAASLDLSVRVGLIPALVAMLIALTANMLVMFASRPVGAALARFNLLGALIRITGLAVMTMGAQMTLDGLTTWGLRSPPA